MKVSTAQTCTHTHTHTHFCMGVLLGRLRCVSVCLGVYACVVQQEGQTSRRDMVTMFAALGGWGHGCVWGWSDCVCACEVVCKGAVC